MRRKSLRKAFAGWLSSGSSLTFAGGPQLFCSGKRKVFVSWVGSHAKGRPRGPIYRRCTLMYLARKNHKFMTNG